MSSFKETLRKGYPGMLAEIADLLREILADQRAFHQYVVERDRRADAEATITPGLRAVSK